MRAGYAAPWQLLKRSPLTSLQDWAFVIRSWLSGVQYCSGQHSAGSGLYAEGGTRTVSSNTLTVVSTIAGIILGFLTSWWFTRSSKRSAEAERGILLNEISALRSLLASVAESVTKPIVSNVGADQTQQSSRVPNEVAEVVVASPRPDESVSPVDLVVRASLGALLNEHGEVSLARLLREVAHSLPDVSPSAVISSLEDLRKTGRVSWSGDDVRKAGIIRVHS
jgi:hypothetical protein